MGPETKGEPLQTISEDIILECVQQWWAKTMCKDILSETNYNHRNYYNCRICCQIFGFASFDALIWTLKNIVVLFEKLSCLCEK